MSHVMRKPVFADAQADLHLCCSHKAYRFSHDKARI